MDPVQQPPCTQTLVQYVVAFWAGDKCHLSNTIKAYEIMYDSTQYICSSLVSWEPFQIIQNIITKFIIFNQESLLSVLPILHIGSTTVFLKILLQQNAQDRGFPVSKIVGEKIDYIVFFLINVNIQHYTYRILMPVIILF